LKNRRVEEFANIICNSEPEKPSTALIRTGSDSQSTSPTAVRNPKLLRGDLDNIVLMAMRKEPERRYASVAQFMEDIKRHLEGLPVIARQDTFKYRASKFIQRNNKRGSNVKVSELLTDAERRANADLVNQPEMQAQVRRTIGNTYVGLGLLSEGERSLPRNGTHTL
jgi:hypothetical protein